MKTIKTYKVYLDKQEFLSSDIYNEDRYESYEQAKSELEKAWEQRKEELINKGHEIIHEQVRDSEIVGYHRQAVVLRSGWAKVIDLRILPSRITLR